MKYRVTVENQTFEIEIHDLDARPVIAYIDGQPFEVHVEEAIPALTAAPDPDRQTPSAAARVYGTHSTPVSSSDGGAGKNLGMVQAPIPGVIVSIAVQPGAQVQPGDELLVLEAMKMKNVIRATRIGTIAAVHVSPGQQVKHHDPLISYTG